MKNRVIDVRKLWSCIFLACIFIILFIGFSTPLIVAMSLFLLMFVLILKINIPKYAIFIFIFSLVLRLIAVFTIKTPPVSDFLVLFNASKSLLNNDLSFLNGSYFNMWSYQIGFVFVQNLLLRIVNNIVFLQIVNCIASSFSIVLIYLIAKEFTDDKSSRIVSIIYSILPFTLTYVTILTNQYLSSLLIYFAFYLLISKKINIKNTYKYAFIGLILAIANVIRPESVIPLVSIALFLVITINKKNLKSNIINIITTIGVYFCVSLIISSLFSVSGLAPNGLKNNDPYWKFVLGFNHETSGSYSNEDTINIGNTEKEIELIKNRVFVSPLKLLNLFSKKIEKFWLDTTSGWSFIGKYENNISIFGYSIPVSNCLNAIESVNNYMMYILYILLFIGVTRYISSKNSNEKLLLILNQVFVTFGVYLLIEVQPRYSYHIQISVAILAALGVHEIIKYINKKKLIKINKC